MSMTETGLRLKGGPLQRGLNLPLSTRTVLVTLDTLRSVLGVDADSILAKVEAGELRWVFNVAVGDDVRELRFWAKELIAPEFVTNLTIKQAIAEILGSQRARWRGTEIAQLLLVSRPTIMRLVNTEELPGDVIGGVIQVPRASLEKFLLARLLNGSGSEREFAQTKGGQS